MDEVASVVIIGGLPVEMRATRLRGCISGLANSDGFPLRLPQAFSLLSTQCQSFACRFFIGNL